MSKIGIDEGDKCNRDGCGGVMVLPKVKDCSGHISPPCNQCVENKVHCSECLWSDGDDDDYVSPEAQKLNDAMERGDYLRDRAKDERSLDR